MSDDGQHALVVIAMLGAPFSPWYAEARSTSREAGDAVAFSAFNVALYGPRGKVWSLVETSRVERGPDAVQIGDGFVIRDGRRIDVAVDAPATQMGSGPGSRVRGRCRVEASAIAQKDHALDAEGRHVWRPLAPCARVEVEFAEPRVAWRGWGYVDSNAGSEPLEVALGGWTWSRAHLPGGRTFVGYEAHGRDGSTTRHAHVLGVDGESATVDAARLALPRTKWGLASHALGDRGSKVRGVRALEDTPFYARSLVSLDVEGEPVRAVHEALSLDRFRAPWVRFLLPFRIQREAPR